MGLMPQNMGAEKPAMPPREMEGQDGEEQSNVTPEEQESYDKFVGHALELISNEKTLPQVKESLKGDGDPVEGLATTAVSIVSRLFDAAEQAGDVIPDEVKYQGSVEILEALATLQQKAGIANPQEKDVEKALYLALDMYGVKQKQQGKLDQNMYKEELGQIQQQAQSGGLDWMAQAQQERQGQEQQEA